MHVERQSLECVGITVYINIITFIPVIAAVTIWNEGKIMTLRVQPSRTCSTTAVYKNNQKYMYILYSCTCTCTYHQAASHGSFQQIDEDFQYSTWPYEQPIYTCIIIIIHQFIMCIYYCIYTIYGLIYLHVLVLKSFPH